MSPSSDESSSVGLRLSTIAARLGGRSVGAEDPWITGVSDLRDAQAGDLVFAESARYLDLALRSRAGAILTRPEFEAAAVGRSLVLTDDPRAGFVGVLELFARPAALPEGIDPSARIDPTARLGLHVRIGPYVTIGAGCTIGDGAVLMDGVRVGDSCEIGAGTVLYANAVLYPRVRVGRACILHSGCVLGADGFGYIPVGHELRKVPHLGTVQIADGVEIGANTCIDRAKTGATVIGAGTKIDNLVHIAHNVRVGRSCLIIAQVGIAGSVEIGDGVILAGQAGVADHVTIGDGARVGGQGGVIGNVAAGETVSGYPARPHRTKMREHAAAAALPDALKRLRAMERRLAELQQLLDEREPR